jgi:3'(2'), 5'-bisphosphate nucleotidase
MSAAETLSLSALLAAIRPVAEEAGRATLAFYGDKAGTREKADGSPVTLADEAAEAVILPALRALTPEIPVVSEEEVAQGIGPSRVGARFWLVDPLDGTKEFISGNGEFTVNIALIEDGRPVLGIVVAPALGETYAGADGEATLVDASGERKILCRCPPDEGETVVGSRSHGDASARTVAWRPSAPPAVP